MKKTLLIVLTCFFSLQSFAQDPDPELFRTWYLHIILATDLDTEYDISEINPAIHPFITFSENLDFTGEGACNTFNGNYEHIGTNEMNAINFNSTDSDCGIQIHNTFENSYFGFLSGGFEYYINQDSDGLSLTFETPIFGYVLFKDFPLSTSGFTLNNIAIYPNPVSDQLNIYSENVVIETVAIYSMNGKKVVEELTETNSIDVSTLSKGIYFIEVSSEYGKTVKKFIKK